MKQRLQTTPGADLAGGLYTLPNLLNLPPNTTPNCLDVRHLVGGAVEKRLGISTLNTVAVVNSLATGFNPDTGANIANNLRAWWKLDEESGNRADAFGTHTLTAVNAPGFASGILVNAASYAAANSMYLLRADTSTLRAGTGNFALTTWVNLFTKARDQTFVSKYVSAVTDGREYRLGYDQLQDRFFWAIRAGATEGIVYATTLGSPATATWYMLTAQVDSTSAISYLQVNTLAANSMAFTGAVNSTTAPFLLGVAKTSPAFQINTGGSLASGLQAMLPLDEASGTRVDHVGANNFSDHNTVTVAPGRVDSGASFILANSEYLNGGDLAAFKPGNAQWAIAFWTYLSDTGGARELVAKWDTGTSEREWHINYSDADRLLFQYQPVGLGDRENFVSGVALNTWTFVVAQVDPSGDQTLISINTGANASASLAGAGGVKTGTARVTIGAGANSTNFFTGTMDQLMVWNRTLGTGEIVDLFRSSSGNRFATDYANARQDETGFFWGNTLAQVQVQNLWNGGAGNTYTAGVANAGYGMFDFGAGNVSGRPLRWLVVAAGTGILASSNRGTAFVAIATDRAANYQYFERSKSFLIATSETMNRVLYWAGSVGTFMLGMPLGSAPAAKHALDFNGFLLFMNHSGGARQVVYGPNDSIATDPFNDTFEIASSADDEITGGITYNTRAYIFTRYTVHQVSAVGGNPDFSVRQVRNWGAVPRTIERVTYADKGEVLIALGWDKKVRIFDGSDDQIISTPIEQDNGLSDVFLENIETNSIQKSHAEVDTLEQVYKLWVAMAPSTEITHCFNLNLRTGAWYPYLASNFNAAVMAESGNSRILTAVKRDGFLYHLNTTNTDAGTPIDEFYDTRHIIGPTATTVHKRHDVAMYFGPTSSGTLYFQTAHNYDRAFGAARDRVMLTGASAQVVTKKVFDLPTTDNALQIRITSSASTADPWRLMRLEALDSQQGQGDT